VQTAQARIPAALASRRGGRLGDVTLDLSTANPGETARITPPAAPPITPPCAPGTVIPPPAPPVYTPPAQNCAPCAPQPGPPQGATCGCAQPGSCGQCGAPPEEEVSNYRHPLFRNLYNAPPRSNVRPFRRAA
jgi:hypothetical protein